MAICNLYTEKQHKISAHRDDERWLALNELDENKNRVILLLQALLFILIETNIKSDCYIRDFQIWNDKTNKWITIPLENRSLSL